MKDISTILSDFFSYSQGNPLIFNSGTFFLLFIIFMLAYTIIKNRRWAVTIFVIIFSLFFYYKSSGFYLAILIFTSITDYSFAIGVEKAKRKVFKKLWLTLAVGSSLAILAFFKYTNFFLENIIALIKFAGDFDFIINFLQSLSPPMQKTFSDIIANNFQPLDIFLPIGISFYTFQSISYVIDVYKKEIPATRNFLDYAFFLSFFPQLVAGPIVKAHHFLPQLEEEIKITKEMVWTGLWLIMIGLFKKAVIADYIAQYNDIIFASPHTKTGFENLMAILGYALQIYCDFSGYSDMAIGMGFIMGFDLGENFNFPYQALNITDFWRRWHISLSSWLRDYLYIPLGGNRKGTFKMYRNLFITMFLGGLWHGANWKFVVWGSAHGIGLAVHKAMKKYLVKIPDNFVVKFFSWLLTFVFVITFWIFFRASDVTENQTKIRAKNASDLDYTSKIISQNDSIKTIQINFIDADKNTVASASTSVKYKLGEKISVTAQQDGKDKIITTESTIDAYKVSLIMINKVITNLDFGKYAYAFWQGHQAWVVLMLIGFLMHATPANWNEKLKSKFVNLPYIFKLILFIIVVQLVIEFKSQDVVPFIYFQF